MLDQDPDARQGHASADRRTTCCNLTRAQLKAGRAAQGERSGRDAGARATSARATSRGRPGVSVVKIEPAVGARDLRPRSRERRWRWPSPRRSGSPLIGKVEIDYEPADRHVRGPEAAPGGIEATGHDVVSTEPMDVDGRVESFTQAVRVLSAGRHLGRRRSSRRRSR